MMASLPSSCNSSHHDHLSTILALWKTAFKTVRGGGLEVGGQWEGLPVEECSYIGLYQVWGVCELAMD